jgi:peroxiredoxin
MLTMFILPLAAARGEEPAVAVVGDHAPTCALRAWDGSMDLVPLASPGKVTYVDFWASWCVPCARSFAFMNDLHDDFNDRGLRIIAVNLDEHAADANRFLERHPARFTIAATDGAQCAHAFGVPGMPSSYVIDRAGTIRHVHVGFRRDDATSLREAIERIVDEAPTRE